MSEYESGEHLGHFACPKHGGSDSLSLYLQSDQKVTGYCWSSCGKIGTKELKELGITDGESEVLVEAVKKSRGGNFSMTEEVMERVQDVLKIAINGWKERRIPAIVNEFYGVHSEIEGDENKTLIREYCPAFDQKDNLVGWHVRNDAVK